MYSWKEWWSTALWGLDKPILVPPIIEIKTEQDMTPIKKSYFTLDELISSETAKTNKIDNTPSSEIKKHLQEVIDVINPLRDAWGSGIKISSGYRCEKLNALVGGSSTSAHKIGYAVDMIPVNGKLSEFKTFCAKYFSDKKFDQLLLEKNTKTNSEWVHLGLYNNSHLQRKQIRLMYV